MLKLFGDIAARWRQDRHGNMAITFALSLTLLAGGVGAALSMAELTKAKNDLQYAVDSASLAAANLFNDSETSEFSLSEDETPGLDRQAIAREFFLQNLDSRYQAIEPTIAVTTIGDKIETTIEARYEVDTLFGDLLPKSTYEVSVSSKASSEQSSLYADIYLLVDNSTSMGIGQTSAERWKMLTDPDMRAQGKFPCAVACHKPGENEADTYDYYKSKGVRMRIDAVTDAVTGFVQALKDEGAKMDEIRYNLRVTGDIEWASIYEDDDFYLETHDAAIAAAQSLELESRPGRTNTQIARSLLWHDREIGHSGSGSSDSDRKAFVIILTDGVENLKSSFPGYIENAYGQPDPDSLFNLAKERLEAEHPDLFSAMTEMDMWDWALTQTDLQDEAIRIQPVNGAACQPLKDKGMTVMVMNIEYGLPEYRSKSNGTTPYYQDTYPDGSYIIPPWDRLRTQTVADFKSRITPALQDCASAPSLVFSVESESEMRRAFEQINTKITAYKSVRLTD